MEWKPIRGDLSARSHSGTRQAWPGTRTYVDPAQRVSYASAFLRAKLSLSSLYIEKLGDLYSVDASGFNAEADRHPDGRMDSINHLLEFEAKCANEYWKEYRRAVTAIWPESGFISRGNTSYSWTMNAADPVNALLNYAYAILEARCRVAVVRAGFDPTIGYLHSIAPSKHPLVYDFQELGRALADSVALEMVRAEPWSAGRAPSSERPTGVLGWLQKRLRRFSSG